MPEVQTKFVTPEGRFSYPYIFEPTTGPKNDQKPKYQCSLVLPKDAPGVAEFMAKIQATVKALIAKQWPDGPPRGLRAGIKDGDKWVYADSSDLKNVDNPAYINAWIVNNASSKNKPQIVDAACQPIMDQAQLKAGYWGRLSVTIFVYNRPDNKGWSCGLNNVMLTREDEPFGNQSRANDDFAAYLSVNGVTNAAPASAEAIDEMFL